MMFNLFQWIVDASQRQPQWWCQQCVKVEFVCLLLMATLRAEPWDAFSCVTFALNLLSVAVLWWVSASLPVLSGLSASWVTGIRRGQWLLSLACVLLVRDAAAAAGAVAGLAVSSFFSFAACRPPAPPKRRPSMRTAGGMT